MRYKVHVYRNGKIQSSVGYADEQFALNAAKKMKNKVGRGSYKVILEDTVTVSNIFVDEFINL